MFGMEKDFSTILMDAFEQARGERNLLATGRRIGPGKPSIFTSSKYQDRSKYRPHVGDRQRARMARQIAAGQIQMKGAGK